MLDTNHKPVNFKSLWNVYAKSIHPVCLH